MTLKQAANYKALQCVVLEKKDVLSFLHPLGNLVFTICASVAQVSHL